MTKDDLQGLLRRALFEPRDLDVVWPAFVELAAGWIEDYGQVRHEILPIDASHMALDWREEMGS